MNIIQNTIKTFIIDFAIDHAFYSVMEKFLNVSKALAVYDSFNYTYIYLPYMNISIRYSTLTGDTYYIKGKNILNQLSNANVREVIIPHHYRNDVNIIAIYVTKELMIENIKTAEAQIRAMKYEYRSHSN